MSSSNKFEALRDVKFILWRQICVQRWPMKRQAVPLPLRLRLLTVIHRLIAREDEYTSDSLSNEFSSGCLLSSLQTVDETETIYGTHCLRAAAASLPGRFFGKQITRDSRTLFSLTWDVHAIHCNRDENHCRLSHSQTGPVVSTGTHDPQTEIKPLVSVVVDRTNRNTNVTHMTKSSAVPHPYLMIISIMIFNSEINFSSIIQTWIHFFWQNRNYLQYNLQIWNTNLRNAAMQLYKLHVSCRK